MNSSGNGETDTHTTKVGLKRKAVHGSGPGEQLASTSPRPSRRQGALPCRVLTVLGQRRPRGGVVRVWARPREAFLEKPGISVVCALPACRARSPSLLGLPRPPRALRANPGHPYSLLCERPVATAHGRSTASNTVHRVPLPTGSASQATG